MYREVKICIQKLVKHAHCNETLQLMFIPCKEITAKKLNYSESYTSFQQNKDSTVLL